MSRRNYWPERWALKHGAIYYVVPKGERAKWDNKSWYRLGVDETEAYATWERLTGRKAPPRTIAGAIMAYKTTDAYLSKKPNTRSSYSSSLARIAAVFGELAPGQITPVHLYEYLDRRPAAAGNRDLAVLSNVLKLCIRRGALTHNVCRDVEKNSEPPRDRYVEDSELWWFAVTCPPELQTRIYVLYLTGTRGGQLRVLPRTAWNGSELVVPGAKRGRSNVYTGGRLTEVMSNALASRRGKRAASSWLFPNRSGEMYTGNGWYKSWKRVMRSWVAAGNQPFQQRDIRAKTASDSETLVEANRKLGHLNMSTTNAVYVRGRQRVEV